MHILQLSSLLNRRHFIGSTIAVCITAALPPATAVELDVPYVTTPPEIIPVMLDMANVTADDHVIDLGTGDGRIVIAAVQRGATGLGVDLDPERIIEAKAAAATAGVADRVRFVVQDLFETDLREASVLTLFLNSEVNLRVRPRLLEQLKPGTRVVSHNFDMGDWQPDGYNQMMMNDRGNFFIHDVYLWIIPAMVSGKWKGPVGTDTLELDIQQQYQQLDVTALLNGNAVSTEAATLSGDKLQLRMRDNNSVDYRLELSVDGDRISGTLDRNGSRTDWSATRVN